MKKNDIIQLTQNFIVEDHKGDACTVTEIVSGARFSLQGDKTLAALSKADYFDRTVKLTKTEMAELFTETNGRVFTVSFTKSNGENRTLRGVFCGKETLMGRSHVKDLDLTLCNKSDMRLVDHRSINWLIYNGVKYIVK